MPDGREPVRTEATTQIEFIDKIFTVINSPLRDEALFNELLKEIQAIVAFDLAAVMTREKSRAGYLKVINLMAPGNSAISKGACYRYQGSIWP